MRQKAEVVFCAALSFGVAYVFFHTPNFSRWTGALIFGILGAAILVASFVKEKDE